MASNYQLGYDDERFETIVNRNFHCLICFNVLKEPVMCQRNQHYFCHGCITEHLRRNSHTCPTCADELSIETLTEVPRIVQDYLDELNIRCDYYDRGCRELVQLQNLKQHVAECGFTPFTCGNQGCGETISKRDRIYHESELCQFRKLKCHNCGEISTLMAGMETEIGKLNTQIANINTKQADMGTKLANVTTDMADVKTNMANINTKMANTDTKLENMNTKMANADTKLDNMNTKMANLQANVEVKFEAVNNEVRGMKISLNEVKGGFEQLKEAVLQKIESKERKQEEITRDVSGTTSDWREKQHIFVGGGWGGNSVEIFNFRQRLWSLLKHMPGERWRASSFVYNNHVTVAGGAVSDDMIQMNIHPIPDLSINWSVFAAKLPANMCAHSSVVYKDSLFLAGGYNKGVISDCIYEIQLKPPYAIKLVSKMPEPRADHSTVLCGDNIFIIGGTKTGKNKDNLSSVVSYDIKKNECQQLPELPYPVSEMATVKWAENAVIIGGAGKDGKALNNVMIYNMKTGHSHMLPPMLHKRQGCMAVVIENTIVVLGGWCEESVEGFSFESYSWEEFPDMNEPRWLATAVVI